MPKPGLLHMAVTLFLGAMLTGCALSSGLTAADGDLPCDERDARLVHVEAVAKDPSSYLGECIALRGVFDGDDIFDSVQRAKSGNQEPYQAKREFSVGGFIDEKKLVSGAFLRGRFWGRLETCSDAYDNLPAPSDGKIYLDRWIIGCQHYQVLHLAELQHGNLIRVSK
ncbi:MAG: hypothetical protein ABMA14_02830 [Hyphomonadaceae bacterium]